MARPTEINFTGLFIPNMLGTFRVLRGFAPLKDLARVSVPFGMTENEETGRVAGHQRDLDERHAQDIQQYLEGQSERFLPEIILSVRFGMAFADNNGNQATVYLTSNDEDRDAMEGVTAKPLLKPSAAPRPYDVWQLSVKEDMLPQIRERRLIRRIDGNHRLEKVQFLKDDPGEPYRYIAPFCMVLQFAPDYEAHNYSEALIFHTINSTAVPLHSEHALKLILGQDPNNAVPAQQEYQLNPALHLTRLLRDQAQKVPSEAKKRLGTQPLTSFYEAAKSMVGMTPPLFQDAAEQRLFAEDLFSGLSDIAAQLKRGHPTLCQAPYFLDIAARVWQHTKTGNADYDAHLSTAVDYLADLGTWLGREGFDGLQDSKTFSAQILTIYEKVRDSIPKNVFMVRWYASSANQEQKTLADLRFEQIGNALKELKAEYDINLNLIDLATTTGGSYLIHPKMYTDLAASDIVVIDLTGASSNVYIETGFALGRDKKNHTLLLFQKRDGSENVPFDLTSFRYESFMDTAQIPDLIKPHIKTIMQQAGMNLA